MQHLPAFLLVCFACLCVSAQETYSHIAAHVPPDNAWVSQIRMVNPNATEAEISAVVFEADQTGVFQRLPAVQFTLAAGAATTYAPSGNRQRWVRFESNRPLAGSGFFSQTLADTNRAKAGIPLFTDGDLGRSLVIPHIPSDRSSFFSGVVLLNPNEETANLSYRFYSDQGNLLDVGVVSAPSSLAANQKWVSTLSGNGVVKGLFDDEGRGEKVSYVVVDADVDLAAFELFGYLGQSIAISGIQSQPNSGQTRYRVRSALTDVSFNGFSILNPDESNANLTVTVLDSAGAALGSHALTLPPHLKRLGLNHLDSGFQFPVGDPNGIQLADGSRAVSVWIESDSELRIFELAGNGSQELDGAATAELSSRTAFANPSGTLNLFKAGDAGSLTVTTAGSGESHSQDYELAANASIDIALAEGLETVVVNGPEFTAALLDRDPAGALTIVNGTALAEDPGSGLPEAQLQAFLEATVADDDAPGAVMVVETPAGRWVGAAGLANVPQQTPLKPDDVLRIGSTTKNFVACVILKLVEEGRLALDNPMSDYLPQDIVDGIEFGDRITIRHLLGMTSGIFNYTDSDPFNDAVLDNPNRGAWSIEEVLAFVYDEDAYFEPGSGWEYSNTNYLLLEMIVDVVSDLTPAAEMRRIIFQPLGLDSIFMELHEAREGGFGGLRVRSYDEGEDITQINDGLGFYDGGLISNAADVAAYASALFRHKSLLSESSLAEMRRFHPTSKYGLGIETRDTAFGEAWAHDGSTGGFQGDMVYLPKSETTFVYITNDFNSGIGEKLFEGAMGILFNQSQ